MSQKKIMILTMFICLGVLALLILFGTGYFVGRKQLSDNNMDETTISSNESSADENTESEEIDTPPEVEPSPSEDETKEPTSNGTPPSEQDGIGILPSAGTGKTDSSSTDAPTEPEPAPENLPESAKPDSAKQETTPSPETQTTPKPESKPSATPSPEAKAPAKEKTPTVQSTKALEYVPFDLAPMKNTDDFYILVNNFSNQETCTFTSSESLQNIINQFAALDITDPITTKDYGSPVGNEVVVMSDGKQYSYNFYSKGIEVYYWKLNQTEFYPYSSGKNLTSLSFPASQYKPLLFANLVYDDFSFLDVDTKIKGINKHVGLMNEHSTDIFYQILNLNITQGSKENTSMPTDYQHKLAIRLRNDTVYNIQLDGNHLYLNSSELDDTYQYTLVKDSNYTALIESITNLFAS